MAGHSKWAQIKRQKAVTDAKKSQVFSKLAKTISLASRKGEDPGMNPELRTIIEKAKSANMPSDNIEKAIKRGAGKLEGITLEEFRFEAYGPGGTAIIIEGITDSRNRTVAEIKHLLSKQNAKWAETGSVTWAFDPPAGGHGWQPKHTIELNKQDAEDLDKLLEALDNHDDIQEIYTNAL
ncbi:YebC/PmpR family DNA-binding transcriptional regulator [Patescibacteria group bacterium]|nr:YebC/PmpR family DNA-binding transcriptional regulator [Patescibacteria group bacterium]